MYYPMYLDPTYILVIIGIVLSMMASARVKSAFNKYSAVRTVNGVTGADAAVRILRQAGIFDVTVTQVAGSLTDHYDPRTKTLRLSQSVYGSPSVAAVSVAAHECGHAIQDQQSYFPLRLRAALVPVTNFGATLSWPLVLIGLLIGGEGSRILINIGIWLFIAVIVFHFVTLPVELDASSHALKILEGSGILHGEENKQAKAVLGAAALTYIASAAAMALQLIRLLLLTQNYRRRR